MSPYPAMGLGDPFDVVETPGFDDRESAGRWSTAPPAKWYIRALAYVGQLNVEPSDVFTVVGLGMLGVGFHAIYAPLGWIVPGAIVVWSHLPQRSRFFEQNTADKRASERPAMFLGGSLNGPTGS